MLKGVPSILSPLLLKVLCEMGHGDRLVIADGNYPAESMGKECIVIRMDGHGVPELLEAVLEVLPLDDYTDCPVSLMEVVPGDTVQTPIWDIYSKLINEYGGVTDEGIQYLERFQFYEESKKAYAIIATGEKALYANIMLQKGVVR